MLFAGTPIVMVGDRVKTVRAIPDVDDTMQSFAAGRRIRNRNLFPIGTAGTVTAIREVPSGTIVVCRVQDREVDCFLETSVWVGDRPFDGFRSLFRVTKHQRPRRRHDGHVSAAR